MKAVSAGAVVTVLRQSGLEVIDRQTLRDRAARLSPVPTGLVPEVAAELERAYPRGLYAHQAGAITASLAGKDISLATSTASGKSLVFMALAAHLLKTDATCRVLALYPARALIQDQLGKWQSFLEPLNLSMDFIDGGVPVAERAPKLRTRHVILMTPDVAHAWLMSRVADPDVATFLSRVQLLILDEAHVYDGVFGTNMAYLTRRLRAAAPRVQLVTSTATLADPKAFIHAVTGLETVVFGDESDGGPSPQKKILLVRGGGKAHFPNLVSLIVGLSQSGFGRWLAFADSRRMVESIVAAAHRSEHQGSVEDEPAEEDLDDEQEVQEEPDDTVPLSASILPYRAGYETTDRAEIERALRGGELAGVVSTSALELGLDIGEIDLVIMLSLPPSVKAFKQRLGRAGRRNPAVCILIDDRGILSDRPDQLRGYLERNPEANYLYLDNRYIQYANALCAATESTALPRYDMRCFESLPETFVRLVENEVNQTEIIASDLYPLKQKGADDPHHVFLLRSDMEQNFDVKGAFGHALGSITLSQSMREAYPGAIYYYMAKPYRVRSYKFYSGEIVVRRTKHWTTQPIAQSMVFPRFGPGVLKLLRSDDMFVAEAEMQVSERVRGFYEQRGGMKTQHLYGPTSEYYQRDLQRFFQTTGVCWYTQDPQLMSEATAAQLLEAFCLEFGIQSRDLGIGGFHANSSPLGSEPCQGVCIYDATNGSLRLTQRLAEQFLPVVKAAASLAVSAGDGATQSALDQLAARVATLRDVPAGLEELVPSEGDWAIVIADGERAMFSSANGMTEVQVLGHRYTPQGLMYVLEPTRPDVKRLVPARALQSINGQTKLIRENLVTGETEELD